MQMVTNLMGTINRMAKGLRSLIQPSEEETFVVTLITCFSWTTSAFNYPSHTLISICINSSSPIQHDLPLCWKMLHPVGSVFTPAGLSEEEEMQPCGLQCNSTAMKALLGTLCVCGTRTQGLGFNSITK